MVGFYLLEFQKNFPLGDGHTITNLRQKMRGETVKPSRFQHCPPWDKTHYPDHLTMRHHCNMFSNKKMLFCKVLERHSRNQQHGKAQSKTFPGLKSTLRSIFIVRLKYYGEDHHLLSVHFWSFFLYIHKILPCLLSL